VDVLDRPHPHGSDGHQRFAEADKEKNITIYRTAVTRSRRSAAECSTALKQAFNGALTPMVQCLLDPTRFRAAELDQLKQSSPRTRVGGKAGES